MTETLPIFLAGLSGALLLLGTVAYLVAFRTESRRDRIVALLYHRLVSAEEFESYPPMERNFTIPEDRFRAHLALLHDQGYRGVNLDAVVAFIRGDSPLPAKPVLITFDDGSESVHSKALPILRELGFPATLFVTTDPNAWIFHHGADAQPRLTDEAICELDRAGVTIGSHAVSHRPLQAMTAEDVEKELVESKRYLEGVIGKPVHYFGVPLNYYGRKVREAAVSAGYRAVCTSDSGVMHGASDLFHLRRLNVEGWFEATDLARQIQPGVIVQRRVINFFKRYPARLLGPRIWFPLREKLFTSRFGPLLNLKNLRGLLVFGAVGLVLLLVWAILLLVR